MKSTFYVTAVSSTYLQELVIYTQRRIHNIVIFTGRSHSRRVNLCSSCETPDSIVQTLVRQSKKKTCKKSTEYPTDTHQFTSTYT